MISTTLFYFHGGNSYYLPYTINQLIKYNPTNKIIFLGDESNTGVMKYGIIHENFNQYYVTAAKFEELYVHMSSNSKFTELKCFQRWLVVAEYCISNNIDGPIVLLDSDVLVYTSFDKYIETYFEGYDIGVCGEYGPGYVIFRDRSIIQSLASLIMSYYEDKDKFQVLEREYEDLKKINPSWSICDMTLINHFLKEESVRKFDMCEIRDGSCFDNHIGKNDDRRFPLNSKGIKTIKMISGKPVCKNEITGENIDMLSLHFQGASKEIMYKYYTGNKKYVPSKLQSTFKSLLQGVKRKAKIKIKEFISK